MSFREFIHPKIPEIDDESLQWQSSIYSLYSDRDSSDVALLHLLPDEGGDLGDIFAYLGMAGLVDRYAVSSATGEGGCGVHLANAEDGVDSDFDCTTSVRFRQEMVRSWGDERKEVNAVAVSRGSKSALDYWVRCSRTLEAETRLSRHPAPPGISLEYGWERELGRPEDDWYRHVAGFP